MQSETTEQICTEPCLEIDDEEYSKVVDLIQRMRAIERCMVDRLRQGPQSPLTMQLVREYNAAKRAAKVEVDQTVDLANSDTADVQWALDQQVIESFDALERHVTEMIGGNLAINISGVRLSYESIMSPSAS